MPKFEYRILTEPCLNSDLWKLQDLLNRLGAEGFEIVSTELVYKDSAMTIVLKRETGPAVPPAKLWDKGMEDSLDTLLNGWYDASKRMYNAGDHVQMAERGKAVQAYRDAMSELIRSASLTEEKE